MAKEKTTSKAATAATAAKEKQKKKQPMSLKVPRAKFHWNDVLST